MSHSQNVESEADAATRKKRKWVETLAGQFGLTGGNEAEAAERPHGSLLLAADPVGETARLQALTAYADDIAARDELMDVDAVEDGDEDESENEDDDPETDPELAVLGEAELRKVGVIRRMRIDTGNEDEDEHSDQDEEVTGDIIPNWSEAKSERRSGKRRKLEPGEAPDEIPAVSATLIHEDAPTTVGTNAKGVKNRVVTAWTMLVTQYQSKNKTTKALDVKDNPVPDQGYMQQTMAARQAYGDVTPEMSEHDMFVFPDPDPAKPEELRNLGWFRHAGPNGPHTVAFTALTSAMAARRAKVDAASDKLKAVRLELDEMIACGRIATPQQVREILMEEEPGLYEPGCSSAKPVFAKDAPDDRKRRVARYANTYTEYYNQLEAFVAELSDEDAAAKINGSRIEAALDRAEELLNLHPYQSFGWRGDDAMISPAEIGGKGEPAYRKRLFDAPGKNEENTIDRRARGMAGLVDGLDPDRLYKNEDRYRSFLINRIEFLIGAEPMGAEWDDLSNQDVDELYNNMLDQKVDLMVEKAEKKRKAPK